MSGLVEEVRTVNLSLAAFAFLNNAEAAAAIADTSGLDFLDSPLGSRRAFGNAAAAGLAVTEMAGSGKAGDEMTAFYNRVMNENGS